MVGYTDPLQAMAVLRGQVRPDQKYDPGRHGDVDAHLTMKDQVHCVVLVMSAEHILNTGVEYAHIDAMLRSQVKVNQTRIVTEMAVVPVLTKFDSPLPRGAP